jgi:hypothetical protein
MLLLPSIVLRGLLNLTKGSSEKKELHCEPFWKRDKTVKYSSISSFNFIHTNEHFAIFLVIISVNFILLTDWGIITNWYDQVDEFSISKKNRNDILLEKFLLIHICYDQKNYNFKAWKIIYKYGWKIEKDKNNIKNQIGTERVILPKYRYGWYTIYFCLALHYWY